MTVPRTRAAGLLVVVLALVLSACGAGGFGAKEPQTPDTSIKSYVALGDGYAAGSYAGKTSSKDGCRRTESNYPTLLAIGLELTDFKDVSCLGADTAAITDAYRPPGAKRDVAAQIDAVSADTDLVTITIGVENNDLLYTLYHLCAAVPCGSDVAAKTARDQLASVGTDLTATIRKIVAKAPQAYVVVVGYPELLPFENGCTSVPRMDDTQFGYAGYGWDQFSTSVGFSARQAGAAYVDVRKLSAEHAPCSKDPWVRNQKTVKGGQVAFHPTHEEQVAVAQAVAAAIRLR